ncbi:MAG TPA: hypothetical protein VGE27_09610 [Gemmatimonas sp.]|uniref:hypothetical protein n=1 Tax=Gemmatimonas sp. TaxID=1962908 RepID=UPI002ED7E99E
MTTWRLLILSAGATLLSSCSLFRGDCVLVGTYGVSVYVTDAQTKKAPDPAPTMRIINGDYVETARGMPQGDALLYVAAMERPGRYRVELEAPGYVSEVRDSVRCGMRLRCRGVATAAICAAPDSISVCVERTDPMQARSRHGGERAP